jgi:hypothetical protein
MQYDAEPTTPLPDCIQGLSPADVVPKSSSSDAAASHMARVIAGLLYVACGGLDIAHNLVTPLCWGSWTPYGGECKHTRHCYVFSLCTTSLYFQAASSAVLGPSAFLVSVAEPDVQAMPAVLACPFCSAGMSLLCATCGQYGVLLEGGRDIPQGAAVGRKRRAGSGQGAGIACSAGMSLLCLFGSGRAFCIWVLHWK